MTLETSNFGVPIDGRGLPARLGGGKAASLDRLVAQGFRVPPASVILAAAYLEFVRDPALARLLKEIDGAPLPAVDHIEDVSQTVEAAFMAAEMGRTLESAIVDVLERHLAAGSVAVRSSALAEDTAEASFAGQYSSFLDVSSVAEGLAAVRRVWASLWLPPAVAYRRREDVASEDVAMAVIVQEMASADWSGVLFTRDPETGPESMRIEAVPGLGEDLVSGRVTPLDYIVDLRNLAIRSRDRRAPLDFLEELSRLGLRVEARAGAPQDIEWALTDEGLFLLQSRPITVASHRAPDDDGFDVGGGPDRFTPRGIEEMLPGVVPPLVWSINRPMMEEAFRRLFGMLGVPVAASRHVLGRFRGRAALNLSLLSDVAEQLGGSAADVERQYLGRALSEDERTARIHLRDALRNWRARRMVRDEVELVSTAVEGVISLAIDPRKIAAARLVAYRRRLRDLAWRSAAAEVAAGAAAADAYRSLEQALARWLPASQAEVWAQRLTAGTLSHAAVGPARIQALREACDEHARRCPSIRDVMARGGEAGRVRSRLLSLGEPGEAFVAEVAHLMRAFGSRSVYAGSSWEEHHDDVWDLLTLIVGRQNSAAGQPGGEAGGEPPPGRALAALEAQLTKTGRWRAVRIMTGQIVDMRKRWLRRLVDDAVGYLSARERAKAALLALGGEERRVILEAARRLRAGGGLGPDFDVELVSDAELEALLLGSPAVSHYELNRRARTRELCERQGSLPETFVGDPWHDVTGVDAEGPLLDGWAASPGVIRGPARVIASLDQGKDLQRGEILVAHSTDPSWTPLFLVAGGVVLEEGGPLSHAAIVAREFGLPAVLNVSGATETIATGDELVVDGTRGVVRRSVEEVGDG